MSIHDGQAKRKQGTKAGHDPNRRPSRGSRRTSKHTKLVTPPKLAEPTTTRDQGSWVWHILRYQYPKGGEIVGYSEYVRPDGTQYPTSKTERKPRSYEQKMKERARRARVRVRRICRAADLTRLWTLTFPSAVNDWKTALDLFAEFVHYHEGRTFGGSYIATAEPHPKGHGYHIHLATNKWVSVDHIRRGWTKFLLAKGFHQALRQDGKPAWTHTHVKKLNARRAGQYIAKYISKNLDSVPAGSQRYRVGEKLKDPIPEKVGMDYGTIDTVIQRALKLVNVGRPYIWRSDETGEWEPPPAFLIVW